MAAPDPFRLKAELDHNGHLVVDIDCPAYADAAYRAELHRLLALFCGAETAQLRYDGEPFGAPFTMASSRSRVQR